MTKLVTLALSAAVLLAGPARGEDPDPPPLAKRVASLESRVAALERAAGVRSGCPCGCEAGRRCTCGETCPAAPKAVVVAASVATAPPPVVVHPAPVVQAVRPSYVTGYGHTHTCGRCGTTWDHGAVSGHNCPNCGAAQWTQDAGGRTVRPLLTVGTSASGCANGRCATGRGLFR